MKRILAIVLPILILAGLGFGGSQFLASLKPEPEEATEPPKGLSVFAEPIELGDLQLTVDAQGEVKPRREIIVASQISGRIAYVSPDFIDGGFIRRGQVLVRLEAEDYESAVIQAGSAVATAQQRLAFEEAQAAQAVQDIKELGLEDTSPLARREPQLQEARAALQAAEARLHDTELGLRRTAVFAPFDGRVREKQVDAGQFVSPGQALGRVFATDVVEVSLPVTDDELGRLGLPIAFQASQKMPGPEVEFSANVAGKPRIWMGQISRTSAAIDSQTRLINVIAELRDPFGTGADDGAPMAPGLFVNASIKGEKIKDVLIAPRAALRSGNKLYLGNREEGKLIIKTVDVLYSDEDGAYLKTGADPGDLAIISPIQAAFDGMNIEVYQREDDGTVIAPPERKAASSETKTSANAVVAGEPEGGAAQ